MKDASDGQSTTMKIGERADAMPRGGMIRQGHRPGFLYQLPIAPYLGECSARLGRRATLDDLPDALLSDIAGQGFSALWLVGVWDRGRLSRELIRNDLSRLNGLRHRMQDLQEDEVLGSPFSIANYVVDQRFGGAESLARLRTRLHAHGLRLILDFVANHTTRDCPWLVNHPHIYMKADANLVFDEDYFRHGDPEVGAIAHGRDPYFPGWVETAQLDIRNAQTRALLIETAASLVPLCDGLQCNMAMLGLSAVFEQTWPSPQWLGPQASAEGEFWQALIEHIRADHPDFLFLAEAYWGREWQLQELGFNYTYDKTLYDRLHGGDVQAIRAHLKGNLAYQARCIRFIENHFQDRAATAFAGDKYQAAALLIAAAPGMGLFVDGQLAGRRQSLPLEVARYPDGAPDPMVAAFYGQLLAGLAHPARQGHYAFLEPTTPDGVLHSPTVFIHRWYAPGVGLMVAMVNYCEAPTKALLTLDVLELDWLEIRLQDEMGGEDIIVPGRQLLSQGVELALKPWGIRLFTVDFS